MSKAKEISFHTFVYRYSTSGNSLPELLDAIDKGDLDYVKDYLNKKSETGFINNVKNYFWKKTDIDTNIIDNVSGDNLLHYAINLNANKYYHFGAIESVRLERIRPVQKQMTDGRLSICKFLLDYYKDVNFANKSGETALHYATQTSGNIDGIKLLLEYGADVNKCDFNGKSGLYYMAQFYKNETDIQLMLDYGAVIDMYTNEKSVLYNAVINNNVVATKLLLGKNPHVKYQYLLENALVKGYHQIVELLLTKDTNILTKDDENYTFLHKSAENGHVDLTKLLIKYLDVNSLSTNNWSSLHMAVKNNHLEIVQLLLENGADVDVMTWDKITPLIIATKNNNMEILQLLLKYNANVNAEDRINNSALYYASCENKNIEMVRVLLENGAIKKYNYSDNKLIEYAEVYIKYNNHISS